MSGGRGGGSVSSKLEGASASCHARSFFLSFSCAEAAVCAGVFDTANFSTQAEKKYLEIEKQDRGDVVAAEYFRDDDGCHKFRQLSRFRGVACDVDGNTKPCAFACLPHLSVWSCYFVLSAF